MGRVTAAARQAVGRIGWYCQTLMGDNHYQRYLDHHARRHTGEPPLSEREYWRRRHAAADADPGARCC
ncbi:YbdD/YjiX family protein [Mycobacterium sp. SMC-8]|uniref:YbdD/YjiX family protein n=1 Tax=Mycobacterium sp. SMC-8 TaxID=2857060 RepID=UPI0021B4C5DA|nr:YbdD/YjiX family protein [Mycobacterium sp. SMC-8]UXA09944.1 YbdD/YjiX family protein [Mycobacterium sp. SMC-8]